MTVADLIRKLCTENSVTLAELARRTGQSRQNFYQKLKRNTLNQEELVIIADIFGASYEQSFVMPNGEKFHIFS